MVAETNDPEDNNTISSGHFLIGRPLTSIIDQDVTEIQENRLSQWQWLQKIAQNFWNSNHERLKQIKTIQLNITI